MNSVFTGVKLLLKCVIGVVIFLLFYLHTCAIRTSRIRLRVSLFVEGFNRSSGNSVKLSKGFQGICRLTNSVLSTCHKGTG